MPPATQTMAATKVAVDRQTNTIMLTRRFAARSDDVFEAWTRPEHVACWWDAAGARLTVCEIDLRPGGAFKFVTQAHPEMPFTGFYREIVPPRRLAFEALGAIGTVLLKDVDGATLMTVTIECGSASQLEQFVAMGVDVGTSQTLDNLVAYIGAMKR